MSSLGWNVGTGRFIILGWATQNITASRVTPAQGEGADFDLRAQQFQADLAEEQGLAFGQHRRLRVARDIARLTVDEEIFFLDAEG